MDVSPLDAARIQAIKGYAELEYQLALLLRFIIDVNSSTAWAIFYQITNTRAKYAIIKNTLEINHGKVYIPAWNKIEKWLTPTDTVRNHLVHWVDDEYVDITMGKQDVTLTSVRILTNAVHAFSAKKMNTTYGVDAINKFVIDTNVIRHIVNRFGLTVHEPDKWPWTDIFQQPIAHQTPTEFLQVLNDAEPRLQPQS
jgi:hypothetical protein